MIVIADTSPLNYLILIGAVDVLPLLYTSVRIPPACAAELAVADAPPAVSQWIRHQPDWLLVTPPANANDSRTAHLDNGEREAIALALELGADLLMIDERDGREAALACGLTKAGTLPVLADAAAADLIAWDDAVGRLSRTTFRVNPRVVATLEEQRKKPKS